MSLNCRFAIISDPHVALPHTIWHHPDRFHLVEVSIPALESIFEQLEALDLDFLLLPGDLTQHGEPDNHAWLSNRLSQLPFPVFVVPGNHDLVARHATDRTIGLADFPGYYEKFGYSQVDRPYYCAFPLPELRLIGLNSIAFDAEGIQQRSGHLDTAQLEWLQALLSADPDVLTWVMIHHNVIEHLPEQSQSHLGSRYMLDNAPDLLNLLRSANVPLLFTGHLHVQDIAEQAGIYEITTGSLVSYPHPYRILELHTIENRLKLSVQSGRVDQVPGWETLQQTSKAWMGDRSLPFIIKLLVQPPLSLPLPTAEALAPSLRHFWAEIADGDALFDFVDLPPHVEHYLSRFGAVDALGQPKLIDNQTDLWLSQAVSSRSAARSKSAKSQPQT